jgi:acyl-coenzyme A synthetase/AMP-(fatty) acid ligase
MPTQETTLDNLSTESRSFPPPEGFAEQANPTAEWYDRADADREGFWAEQADRLSWAQRWDEVVDWQPPFARWFVGGKLNVAYNCADRHVEDGHGEQVALHWEGEPGDTRTITYADLQREVCKAANALAELGVEQGDRVAIQLPMIPEAVFAMLACARLGAAHSVVFGGFSAGALKARILDAQAKVLITSDGQFRRGKPVPMKENTDEAVAETPSIPDKYDLSSLKVLGSVGEPINPEAWMWYRENIGHDNCPIVDTWWQTETGAIMISPLPGVTATKPGSAMRTLPGISAEVVTEEAQPVGPGGGGYLVLDKPWPAMLRGIWGDEERYRDTYWSRFAEQGYYFAGDGAKYDDDGAMWLLGRVDDVMNVSGHRISTTEVESALVSHPTVAEAAVVGASDPTTGQGIVAFVILRGNAAYDESKSESVFKELRDHVAKEIGPIAKPRQIMVVEELPKTRSGKIMRRLLKDVAENRDVGDVTTLADSSVMNQISSGLSESKSED